MRVIAIDGPAGSGKSTVAKALAARIGLKYLDTGAMYRAVTFAALRLGVDPADHEPVAKIARELKLRMNDDGTVRVDGADATIEIRGPEVTLAVSSVAANSAVREEMRSRQREWAVKHNGGVMEGRDIGTVVFPDAELKVYLDAEPHVRADRRSKEVEDLSYESVASDIARRDALDQGRDDSPLRTAADAIIIDTSNLTIDNIVDRLVERLAEHAQAQPTSSEQIADDESRARRPIIEKAKADRTIIIPEGHQRGEVMSRWQRLVYRLTYWLCVTIGRTYFRTKVYGTENVPSNGAFILSPIHRSNLDTPLTALVTRRRMRYMGKESLWKTKFGAWYLTAAGGFPVDRATADRDALRACLEIVQRGEPLVMFPEGTRQFGPTVCETFDGPAYVACRAQVPIVPVGIGGSERALGKGAKFPRPTRMTIVIGKPIDPPTPPASGRVPRRAVKELTEQLRDEIQVLFDEAQSRAGCPNSKG